MNDAMDILLQQLIELREQTLSQLELIDEPAELDSLLTGCLGRKGTFKGLIGALGQMPLEERRAIGLMANQTRQTLETAFEKRREDLRRLAFERTFITERTDVTLPGRPVDSGRLHLTTLTLRRIYAIFAEMGFQVFDAPEVETDEYNFQLLNLPPGHPAREMWSTFHTTHPSVLLRTHTSPGQIRAMRKYHPDPIRVILPGKVYRYEQVDATHEWMFYQVEGLAIGRRITMADLKGALVSFCAQMFGAGRRVRFRCSHFPFTEPSAEVELEWGDRWLEILGCGMVHPSVLTNGGYDPTIFSGFAFGMGVERIAMLLHGINDIRIFYGNDPRFLAQFGQSLYGGTQ